LPCASFNCVLQRIRCPEPLPRRCYKQKRLRSTCEPGAGSCPSSAHEGGTEHCCWQFPFRYFVSSSPEAFGRIARQMQQVGARSLGCECPGKKPPAASETCTTGPSVRPAAKDCSGVRESTTSEATAPALLPLPSGRLVSRLDMLLLGTRRQREASTARQVDGGQIIQHYGILPVAQETLRRLDAQAARHQHNLKITKVRFELRART